MRAWDTCKWTTAPGVGSHQLTLDDWLEWIVSGEEKGAVRLGLTAGRRPDLINDGHDLIQRSGGVSKKIRNSGTGGVAVSGRVCEKLKQTKLPP
jgi:hypothetical protein